MIEGKSEIDDLRFYLKKLEKIAKLTLSSSKLQEKKKQQNKKNRWEIKQSQKLAP